MLCFSKSFRSPLKTHGGKHYIARDIIAVLPECSVFWDIFGGGANVVGNVDPVYERHYNEIDPLIYKFWTDPQLAYTEATFLQHRDTSALVRTRGGLGKDFAWSERLRGGEPGDVHAWKTILRALPAVREQFHSIHLHNENAFDLIPKITHGLLYLDPPYLPETRVSPNAYNYELSHTDHQKLLALVVNSPCPVAISGYHSPLYDQLLRDWQLFEWDVVNRAGKGHRKECLWIKRCRSI